MRDLGLVRTAWFLAFLGTCAAFIPAVAGTDYEALPPSERVKKDLLGMQNNITNAKMRLRSNLAGAGGAASSRSNRPPTPAESCCTSNIERIRDRIRRLTATLEELDLYYAEQKNSEALDQLKTIRERLGTVAQGVSVFKMAGTRDRAGQALAGLIRPFNDLRNATISLEVCCPIPAPTVAGEGDPKPGKKAPGKK